MDDAREANEDQAVRWNGVGGRNWVKAQAVLDGMFEPLEDLVLGAVSSGSNAKVLDVGCGTGGTTLAVARRLGPEGRCTGIDISEPMIAAAQARAERERLPASFVRADVQTHAFAPGGFDAIVSRLGVMFFEDSVGAFANLRHAAKDRAALRFVAWRSAAENPFMTLAERAAAPLLPNLPPRQPGPGQFAFADGQRIHRILEESGWSEIDIRPVDLACTLPEPELARYLALLGPIGLVLHEVEERLRERVIETVRAAYECYVQGAEVPFTAACWSVSARALSGSDARRGASHA